MKQESGPKLWLLLLVFVVISIPSAFIKSPCTHLFLTCLNFLLLLFKMHSTSFISCPCVCALLASEMSGPSLALEMPVT